MIAAEDSNYNVRSMFILSTMAYLSSKVPFWKLSEQNVNSVSHIALNLLMSSVTSTYRTNMSLPELVSWHNIECDAPAWVMQLLGGMTGDKQMLRFLRARPMSRNIVGKQGRPLYGSDPLDVYCDQHQDGRIIYLVKTEQRSYTETLLDMFHEVSGHNTRRKPRTLIKTRDIQMIWDALAFSSRMRRKVKGLTLNRQTTSMYEWIIPDGAIAGMVGVIEVKSKTSYYYVTVRATDIHSFVVIPRPSRITQKNIGDISTEEKNRIIRRAKSILAVGITANNVIHESFRGKRIRYMNDAWTVQGVPWSHARVVNHPLQRDIDWKVLYAPRSSHWPWTKTFGHGQIFSERAKQWVVGRLSGYDTTVSMPKVSRSGKGVDEALCGLEAEGFQYAMHIAEHFPDALTLCRNKAFTFQTKCLGLRQEVVRRIRNCIQPNEVQQKPWSNDMVLRPTQELALSEMMRSHQHGLSIFLWMLVGQGKTLTVLSYLQRTNMSKYVMWALPNEALDSVATQIGRVGWKPIIYFPSETLFSKYNGPFEKRYPNPKLIFEEGTVAIVRHDDLRRFSKRGLFDRVIPDTAFIFERYTRLWRPAPSARRRHSGWPRLQNRWWPLPARQLSTNQRMGSCNGSSSAYHSH